MKKIVFIVLMCFATSITHAQESSPKDTLPSYTTKRNIIKANLTGIPFRNFQFQAERVLNKTFSLALSYGIMPKGHIPMKNLIKDFADNKEDAKNLLDNAKISHTSITPELRIYLGKGYGKGFYLAPFYKYSKYNFENLKVEYYDDNNKAENVMAKGAISANTVGLLLGAQFNLGKNIVLDWWIVGPNYGLSKGKLTAKTTATLSASDQASLKEELNEIDFPMTKTKNTVSANGAEITIDGPWGGFRAGLNLGIRF